MDAGRADCVIQMLTIPHSLREDLIFCVKCFFVQDNPLSASDKCLAVSSMRFPSNVELAFLLATATLLSAVTHKWRL